MYRVTVQVRKPSLSWEATEAIQHTFKDWIEVSTFAYRLALQTRKEIRVENKGNGHYYNPDYAEKFLSLDTNILTTDREMEFILTGGSL